MLKLIYILCFRACQFHESGTVKKVQFELESFSIVSKSLWGLKVFIKLQSHLTYP